MYAGRNRSFAPRACRDTDSVLKQIRGQHKRRGKFPGSGQKCTRVEEVVCLQAVAIRVSVQQYPHPEDNHYLPLPPITSRAFPSYHPLTPPKKSDPSLPTQPTTPHAVLTPSITHPLPPTYHPPRPPPSPSKTHALTTCTSLPPIAGLGSFLVSTP